jgi:carbon-monoxide dehydrogenase medium subunit
MKPPPFSYAAPVSLDEALALLGDPEQDEPRALAGGQSLVPLLNLRLARPTLLVDLNSIPGLDSVELVNGHVRLGATVRQRTLETDSSIRERLPLLAEAASRIAHLAIRTRGTVGGSLAHADPAAELPVAMTALRAQLHVRGRDGSRVVPGAEFFLGPYTTAIVAGEVLEAVEVPLPPAGAGWAFLEVARVHGAFALAGVAALLALGSDRRISDVRVAVCGVGGKPFTPGWLAEAVVGELPREELFSQVGERVREDLRPDVDAYRREVTGVLSRRALTLAAERATAQP